MKLTDIVSNMNLDVYPIVALILFLVAFSIIVWGVLKTPRSFTDHQAHLPLEDDFGIQQGQSHDRPSNMHKGVTHG